jgi:CP family cyanate transporter-like MFS transporter
MHNMNELPPGPPAIDAEADFAPPPAPAAGSALLAAAIVLIALNLRAAVTSIGPVLRDIIAQTGLSALGASALTTLPSLCFGLAAFAAPGLAHRLGTERAVLASLGLMTVGTALRAPGGVPALFVGQILACAGIGIVNVLLPGLVKRDFPRRVPLLTGLYTMAFCAGAAFAAGATVPLAHAFGAWSISLGFWALPVAVAAAAWITRLPPSAHAAAARRFAVRGVWRDPLSWQVTMFMGLQSALAYIVFGWLPPILRDRGMSAVDAGLVLSVSVVAQAVACLFAPAIATRGRDQRGSLAGSMALCLIGLLGAIYAPLPTVWLWSVVLGIAQGALIAIALTVIALRAGDAHVAAHLSGMAQGVGYLLASFGPLLAGLLHFETGGWDAVAAFCVAIGVVAAGFGWGAGRARVVRAVTEKLPR